VSTSANALTGQAKFTAEATGAAQAEFTYSFLDTLYFSRPGAATDEFTPILITMYLDGIVNVSDS
jgi:hypothetical protein